VGVIETLSAGFDLVRRRIWLILVPVVLDVALWIAPRLSIFNLIQGSMHSLAAMMAASPDIAANAQDIMQVWDAMARSMNLLWFLSSPLVGSMPSLKVDDSIRFFGLHKMVLEVPGGTTLLMLLFILLLFALLIAVLYLELIGQQVRDGHNDLVQLFSRLGRDWLRFITASVLSVLAWVFVLVPSLMVAVIFASLVPLLGLLGLLFVGVLVWWVAIYLAFVPTAIILNEDGVMRAILGSIGVVRRNFGAAFRLLLLQFIITLGLTYVWQLLSQNAVGTLVAIVGNAFVGTGITAAIFIYYRDRFEAWQLAARGGESKA